MVVLFRSVVAGANGGSNVRREPCRDGLSPSLIQQEMQLGAAEQEVFSRHCSFGLDGMDQLGPRDGWCDLLREVRLEQQLGIKLLDLVSVGEGPAVAGLAGDGRRALGDKGEKCRARFAATIKGYVLGPRATHVSAEAAQLVEHSLGEGAVRGELAAIKGDEAAAAVGNAGKRRAASEPAWLPPATILQGADAGEAPHHIGGGGGSARRRKVPVIGFEQIELLLGRAGHSTWVALFGHLGGADDDKAPVEPGE